jgi:transposase
VVDETQQYSVAEMERMMKVQDVLLKAMANKITWWAAAEILGVSDRTIRRWRERYRRDRHLPDAIRFRDPGNTDPANDP